MPSDLAVVMFTYAESVDSPRHAYAKRTCEALIKNVHYSGKIHWHIADDGSPMDCIRQYKFPSPSITISRRMGYGASYNLFSQFMHSQCSYFLMVEDDWELVQYLDLDPLVAALDEGLGCIRLGYIGWTQELRGKLVKKADQTFLQFDPDSPEPHVWAGHPRIETLAYQRSVGPWPEGYDPGSTEFMVAKEQSSREGVAWPMDLAINASQQHANLFCHIGSVQARKDQNHA